MLSAIPIVDLREGGPPRHARNSAPRARALRDACLGFLPRASLPLVPALDWASRNWLERSRSPYVDEIGQIASALDFSGVWLLNASYQWACTSLAVEHNGAPWILRTLDWPFLGLGRYAEVAHMHGDCGDFYSVTWPGYVGALTAMARRWAMEARSASRSVAPARLCTVNSVSPLARTGRKGPISRTSGRCSGKALAPGSLPRHRASRVRTAEKGN